MSCLCFCQEDWASIERPKWRLCPEWREVQGLGLAIVLTNSGHCWISQLTSPGLSSFPSKKRETTICKAKYLLTSSESEIWVVGPFLQQKPRLAQDCAAIYPQQSGVSGTLLFSTLHTSSSRALPLTNKLEQMNESPNKGTMAVCRHRDHNAWMTVR